MEKTSKPPFLLVAILLFLRAISSPSKAEPFEDKEALLDFIRNVHHTDSPNWDEALPLCFLWAGVTCNGDNSRVISLRLDGIGIHGELPSNTLSRLTEIHTLSLGSNAISGSFPSDLYKLRNLTHLHLESNNFTGPLPYDFSVWNDLAVIDLSGNQFNGSIPPSLLELSRLERFNLSSNLLTGRIPDIGVVPSSLQELDLRNNRLVGTVPRSLLRYPSSAFAGNDLQIVTGTGGLPPVEPPSAQPLTRESGRKTKKKVSEPAILGIVIGSCVMGFVAVALLMIWKKGQKKKEDGLPSKSSQNRGDFAKKEALQQSREKSSKNRVVFFEGCSLAFDLEDLLRASAEVLGKGTYGTTYKASLEDSTTVVVKRLKEVTVTKRDFEQMMESVGSVTHENVCPLRAYYYSKDEKLVVYDFYDCGSVSAMLHGRRGEGRRELDWETRMRIAVGAARGIAYLHAKFVHGNVKASNVFLNSKGYGSISDVGLATLMSPMPAPVSRAAGYGAPEITDPRKGTTASDVYSFGVLLLELLTGKSPTQTTGWGNNEAMNLVRWVTSMVREEWTGEVFDVELMRCPNIEEEMVEMLQIGMNCVVRTPEKRPKMADVVKMVEGVRRVSSGSRTFSPDGGFEIGMSSSTPTATGAGGASSSGL